MRARSPRHFRESSPRATSPIRPIVRTTSPPGRAWSPRSPRTTTSGRAHSLSVYFLCHCERLLAFGEKRGNPVFIPSFASASDFPSQGRDFSSEKSLINPPVADWKPLKGKSDAEPSEKTMVVCRLVANQGASHPTGTTLCSSKSVLFSKNLLRMPLSEGDFLQRKDRTVRVWSWMGGILVGRHV